MLVLLSQKQGTSVSYFLTIYILKMDINGCMYLFGYDTLIHLNCWLLLFCLYPIAVNYPNMFVILKKFFFNQEQAMIPSPWNSYLLAWWHLYFPVLIYSELSFLCFFLFSLIFLLSLKWVWMQGSDLSSVLIPNTSPELWHYILITEHVHIYFQLTA